MISLIAEAIAPAVGEKAAKALAWALVIGLLAIAGATALHVVDALTETAEQKGAAVERVQTQGKVIENAAKSKAAAESVVRDGGPSHDECVRDSRNPANC